MTVDELQTNWNQAIQKLLGCKIDKTVLYVLAKQSNDSIRRIDIYKTYRLRAIQAAEEKRDFFHTSNPFVLSQRSDLNVKNKIWLIYLATYFGKSESSGWNLFLRAAFDGNNQFILFEKIEADIEKYFRYLESFDFFENANFSNHRKFTKKALDGEKGFFRSMTYLVENIEDFCNSEKIEFHEMYKMAIEIPNFGRLASFDFTSSSVKCGLKVNEPQSMYASHSTGPLQALGLLLRLCNREVTRQSQIELSNHLVQWFNENTDIFMVGQVLEDAICNWQKNPRKYIYYKG